MSSHVWAFVACSGFVFFLFLSRLYFLSHCLPVLCPAHQFPFCRNRRGLKPVHSRTMRSIAPWRYTTHSQVMSLSSSTMSLSEKRYLHQCSLRSSEPETSLSLTWRKFVASSVLCRTHKYGRTRKRTKFVSKTEIRSRHGKRKNKFSLKDKKSKFSLKSEPRSRSTNFKPCLTEEVSWNQVELLILSERQLIIRSQVMNNPGEINY